MKTVLLFTLILAFSSARAADLWGSYTWIGTTQEATSMEQAVHVSADSAHFLIRPVVRRRLLAVTHPHTNIVLTATNGVVWFNRDGAGNPVEGPLGGTPFTWTREDGRPFTVRCTLDNGALTQEFSNEDGTRINCFRLAPDGRTLTMSVLIKAGVLKKPVSFTQTFVKEP